MTRPQRPDRRRDTFVVDPLTGTMAEFRRVQPFQARKDYICPGCNQEIRVGAGHIVIVPLAQPDMRRHWHTPCFERARRQGRAR